MTIARMPGAPGGRALGLAIAALTVTQLVGWGSTFHAPAVLADRMAAGTGIRTDFVFGGATLMLLVAAAFAPATGRLLDRYGAGRCMAAGSLVLAGGLALLAAATGPLLFGLGWLVVGFGIPLSLNQASSTALVQIAPGRARSGIALLMLLLGLSTSISWPLLIWLDGLIGWRGTLLAAAATHLALCLPLHLLALPRRRSHAVRGGPAAPAPGLALPGTPEAPPRPVRGAFLLSAIAFSLAGVLTWGLPMHLIAILRDYGHAEAAAVAIGALLGPAQVASRGFEMLGGARLGILFVGVLSAAAMPVALVVVLIWGAAPTGAVLFSVLYGLSAGLSSIVRAVGPLRLFGPAAYALVLGRLSVPQNIAFAMAPLGFASVRQAFGSTALLSVCLAIGLVSLAAMAVLERRAAAAERA